MVPAAEAEPRREAIAGLAAALRERCELEGRPCVAMSKAEVYPTRSGCQRGQEADLPRLAGDLGAAPGILRWCRSNLLGAMCPNPSGALLPLSGTHLTVDT